MEAIVHGASDLALLSIDIDTRSARVHPRVRA
jgi:hypothetical protein